MNFATGRGRTKGEFLEVLFPSGRVAELSLGHEGEKKRGEKNEKKLLPRMRVERCLLSD